MWIGDCVIKLCYFIAGCHNIDVLNDVYTRLTEASVPFITLQDVNLVPDLQTEEQEKCKFQKNEINWKSKNMFHF